MAQEKSVHQVLTPDGQAACQAVSAPDWFALDCTQPAGGEGVNWGSVYSQPRFGNKVEFFTTGKKYFENVQEAIESASSSVFIAGWQVNFDVELTPGRTLLNSLKQALKNGANVYVMPWFDPGPGGTQNFLTALAVPLLNGVPDIKGRAYCLQAPVQSDQGIGTVLFSHHQKSVVIDNKVAFMGGIDLAYGRRDDEAFSLKANGRRFNEIYNRCVPPVGEFQRTDVQHCVTMLELLAAIGTKGLKKKVLTFLASPSEGVIASSLDTVDAISGKAGEYVDSAKDFWNNTNLLPDFLNSLQDVALDWAMDKAQDLYRQQTGSLKQQLEAMASTGAANAANASSAVLAWLSGQSIQALPLALQQELVQIIGSLGWLVAMTTNSTAWSPPEYYERLFTNGRALPASAVDADRQPRMPWQDVQCRIEGPSVFDLSRNFTDRWNSVAHLYESTSAKYRNAVASKLTAILGIELPKARKLPRIEGALTLKAPAAPNGGQCTVQVMRSASKTLLRMEAAAKDSVAHLYESTSAKDRNAVASKRTASLGIQHPKAQTLTRIDGTLPRIEGALKASLGIQHPKALTLPPIDGALTLEVPAAPDNGEWTGQVMRSASKTLPERAENNCLKAMLKAISSARHFIYIEGQFFQTAHGRSGPVQGGLSGPMGSLLQLKDNAHTRRFLDMLEIRGAKPSEIPARIRWAKIDDVMRLASGPEFLHDLVTVLKNIATREALTKPTAPQAQLLNPIGKALIERITRVGLKDGRPFHVYMVLPVHPEGTLNTLNIMSQVHLTMHSLVFGEHSLVNGVRRAILTDRIRREKKISWAQAQAEVNAMTLDKIERTAPDDWKRFVTLLNLRNWDTIGGQPVTEQIYVHSKLLIADDQVAVLGSANINDRSMLGDRDSELATVITSRNAVHVPLAGPMQSVAKEVHELRVGLWKKHFGDGAPNRKASALLTNAILKSPGVPATWQAIQAVSEDNAKSYNAAFWYIPRSEARPEIQPKEPQDKEPGRPPASIWPTWKYQTYLDHGKGGRLLYRMPFDPLFWREAEHKEVTNSWTPAPDATQSKAPVTAPRAIQGFIVALPTEWTRSEDNLFSKSHIATIAANEMAKPDTGLAMNQPTSPKASTV